MRQEIDIKKTLSATYVFVAFAYVFYKFAVGNMANFALYMLIAFWGIYYFITQNIDKRANCANEKLIWVMSALFSVATVTGCYFTNELIYSRMKPLELFMYFFCIGGFTIASKCIFVLAYLFFERWAEREALIQKETVQNKWKTWGFAFVIIMASWIIVWLAYYPGLWNYDPYQVAEVLYNSYTKHHPLLHTLLLGNCYVWGLNQGNANLGVILYDYIQMIIMASIFAYAYVYIKEQVSSKVFRALTLFFFSCFPVNTLLAISITKDTLFSGFVLLCFILSLKYFEGKTGKRQIILLIIITTLMLLYRNNALYALLLVIFVALLFVKHQKQAKKVVVFIALSVVLCKAVDTSLTTILSAEDGPSGEMFSVPIQQMGRIHQIANALGDEDSKQLVEQYFDMTQAQYFQRCSDYMKTNIKNIDDTEGVIGFLKTSLELFKRYPMVSLESAVFLTQGYWDVNDISHADIYGYKGIYRFGYLLTEVFEGYGITRDSKIPVVEKWYEDAFSLNEYQNLPIIPLIFAPATYLWFLMFCTLVMIKHKEWNNLILYSFLWFYMLTLFLGPCVLVRYVYYLIVCTPLLICTLLNTISKRKLEDNNG